MVEDVSSPYLHKTERTTNAFLREELGFSAGCSALQTTDAWLSWAVGLNLIVLVTDWHPLHISLVDEEVDGDDAAEYKNCLFTNEGDNCF